MSFTVRMQNLNQYDMNNFFPPHPPPPSASTFFASQPPSNMHSHHLLSYPSPALQPNAGLQILALLNKNSNNSQVASASSSAVDRGRRVLGDYLIYDVDAKEGERESPQLEATQITKYGSDRGLVVGRQIAVNKHYVCYGLKDCNVRVLNVNKASRSLFRGHTKVFCNFRA